MEIVSTRVTIPWARLASQPLRESRSAPLAVCLWAVGLHPLAEAAAEASKEAEVEAAFKAVGEAAEAFREVAVVRGRAARVEVPEEQAAEVLPGAVSKYRTSPSFLVLTMIYSLANAPI